MARHSLLTHGTDARDTSRVDSVRTAWIEERKARLDSIFSTHDSLVREAFHLEKFVTLLSYDPKAAKEDKSVVFQEYQAHHDLLLEQSSAVAGPSRRTRKAHTERLQLLKAPSVTAPLTTSSKRKRKTNQEPENPFWSILAASKSTSALVSRRGKGKGRMAEDEQPGEAKGAADVLSGSTPHSARGRQQKRERPVDETSHISGHLPATKKRKLAPKNASYSGADPNGSVVRGLGPVMHPESVSTVPSKRSSGRLRNAQQESAALDSSPERASPSKNSVKRIRLIVRRPLPALSHPRQKPPPPRYGGSVAALLSSYTTLDDKDVDIETLEQKARKDAAFWDKVDSLRRQGRLYFTARDFSADTGSDSRNGSSLPPPSDTWAHIVEEIQSPSLVRPPDGRVIISQIVSKVRAYWDVQTVKEDKIRAQEEKRLRALAKTTMKLVIAEWKKAVHHIREQHRLKREEEERRRGHQHLDAILDQSGQILEAQQAELSKAASRSRSSSVAASLHHWASVTPESDVDSDNASGTNVDSDDTSSDSQSDRDADEEIVDSSFLLGDISGPTSGRTSPTPTPSRSPSMMSIDTPESAPGQNLKLANGAVHSGFTDGGTTDAFAEKQLTRTLSSPVLSPPLLTPPGSQQHIVESNMDSFAMRAANGAAFFDSEFTKSPSNDNMELLYPDGVSDDHLELPYPDHDDTSFDDRAPPADSLDELFPSLHEAIGDVGSASQLREDVSNPGLPAEEVVDSQQRANATDRAISEPPDVGDNLPKHDAEDEPATPHEAIAEAEEEVEEDESIPHYLRPYAVTPVEWDPQSKVKAPFLLRGTLRPYQQAGLEWLASIHANNLNAILADEMGLGKTIQTIALLAHLACDRGIWGPHLIIVPTSVLLNWEMEFKKFLPGFKVLSYHGTTKRRKELRQGWNNKYHFNVCVTSYALASRDAHVFKRKPWYYMILDEAHMIKNFKSQRWNTLLMFRSFRRLLLTGTPLQNNLTELWALLQFLMSGTNFANLKEFGEWFSNPVEKAIEMGTIDDETQQRVAKLHTVLRPYLLRRLKRDVEKELPRKFEHLVMCYLSKRQRFLYDEFMARAETRHDLQSGMYHKIANILMQLRKVVNHPDLFEVRPILTSFAMERSAIADYEIKELLIRRQLLHRADEDLVNLDILGLQFIHRQNTSLIAAAETHRLDGTSHLPLITELPGEPPPRDTRSVKGFTKYRAWQQRAASIARWSQIGYLNRLRCNHRPILSRETIDLVKRFYRPLRPLYNMDRTMPYMDTVKRTHAAIRTYSEREEDMADIINRFAFVTPAVITRDLPRIALSGLKEESLATLQDPNFDAILHRASVKLQIAFPDPLLLQYDCGKLQELARLLRERKAGGHRVLIFTQMTRILDILEIFLNFHGYLYLRLDGATKIEDRQYITERFNSDSRIFCFISSSRSGGVGINLTGADTVIFYDSDFNPQMDRQCEDRAHRIGQIRDVHIYRFVSQHTVEEALLRKANQKRSLDDLVIQKGEFDWRSLFHDENALTKALGEVEDTEDARAAAIAAREEFALEGANEADFGWEAGAESNITDVRVEGETPEIQKGSVTPQPDTRTPEEPQIEEDQEDEEDEEGGTIADYMLSFVQSDVDFFAEWRL
ncbi:hypothetical protein OBBRIDRAFT_306276 [Obba rivulosa]|uniref:DNA helicase n=1 Tax=Obba rivulosa TaxID=1052685 RepID=A0A8E2DPQ6_9APHY|nr:hypothetical protein OBBRIDRAFT_306276 [Obba rivulosa]